MGQKSHEIDWGRVCCGTFGGDVTQKVTSGITADTEYFAIVGKHLSEDSMREWTKSGKSS